MTLTTTPVGSISEVVDGARAAFASGRTRPLAWREDTLRRLRRLLVDRTDELEKAMADDLRRPAFEAWIGDTGFAIVDIDHTLAHLPGWMRPERVATPLSLQPGASRIVPEPLGVVCVIAPWNYPVQLTVLPLVAAIAAGNAVVVKPSELAPASAEALGRLITDLDDPAIAVVQGGVAETTELLEQRFDHILYTGNGRVARVVMKAAAEHLTPVTLELGGKSPAIVSRNAKIGTAARRIVSGKGLNAGQSCVAPDYVLVDRAVHDELVSEMGDAIREFYGDDPKASADFGRIVNDSHFHRLEKLLHDGTVAVGGESDPDELYIAPTILTGVKPGDPVMDEEIFGPVLPVLAVDSVDEAIEFVNRGDKPLALYVFSEEDDESEAVIGGTSSGGAGVNATMFHVTNPHLPFGGVGPSGTGAYHGKFGFDTFSHHRGVLERSTKVDPALLYPPYTDSKESLVRRVLTLADPRQAVAGLVNRLRRRG